NTTTGTITVTIVDDVATAVADTDSVGEGGLLTVDAASGVLSNDTAGADGATIAGVRHVLVGDPGEETEDSASPVSGGVGTSLAGLYGTLTLAADGSYSYKSNPDAVPPG